MRVPYVVDFDDAIFHTYDQHRSSLVRWILGQKLAPLILRARSVVVGNGYLESYVRGHGAHKVVRIPTVVDIQHYRVVDEPPAQEIRIGWIGTPETAHYLYIVRAALRSLGSERAIRLVTIGAPPLEDFGVPMEQHPWTENTESEVLQGIHIGIMPLPDQAWERGKCAYKLIQYMACGRPVIASPVGVNRDIVTNDVGILASTSIEWTEAFRVLASDPIRRRACGAAARRLIEREYSLEATAPRLVRLLQAAGS
jgi:glycosyltransferase involved in cell wall biosynthesis